MKNLVSSKNFSLNKSTYVNLRWIAILGQLLTINSVKFIFQFEFNFILANIIVLFGALSNILLIYIFKKTQLSEKVSLYFLTLDIFQLSFLLYLTGGTINPFSIFVLLPSIFAASSLNLRSNLFLISITFFSILILSFYHYELPSPLNQYIIEKQLSSWFLKILSFELIYFFILPCQSKWSLEIFRSIEMLNLSEKILSS